MAHTARRSSIHSQDKAVSLKKHSTVAFAFDIDGVLVRSKKALPGASAAIKKLQLLNIPFIFLTNGGGSTEKDHVKLLGKRLGLNLDVDQFIQSHTPYRDLVPQFGDKNILALGGTGHKVRELAHAYGFKSVVTSSDLAKAYSSIYPFLEITGAHHNEHGLIQLPRNSEGRVQIHAILVWSTPRDWGLDLQLIVDLLLSEQGQICKRSKLNGNASLPNHGYLQDGQPSIHFCNPDLTWATSYDHPRAAQGAFKSALEGVWASQTNGAQLLNQHVCGKPTTETYTYGERALQNYNLKINGPNKPIRTVYMVGDNPASDIRGANAFQSTYGSQWKGILVESGIYQAGDNPAYKPENIVPGVEDAVDYALIEEDIF